MNGRMTERSMRMGAGLGIAAGLMLFPALGSIAATGRVPAWQASGEQNHLVAEDRTKQEQREAEEEARRDAEQDARDREQDKKAAEEDRKAQMQDMYDSARQALDEGQYAQAAKKFQELAQMNGAQTDAALYWLAYAENKQGKRDSALATVANLKKSYPQSRWTKDATALEIEIRQNSGTKTNPDAVNDEELKLLALQGLMNSDPDKALPLVEKVLNGNSSSAVKSKALFVLAQSGSPQAMEILGKVALGQRNPELQRKAVEYLGIFGGSGNSAHVLAQVYSSTSDPSVKHAVLKSYMIAGDKQSLFNAAKSERNEDLKREAIKQLGLVGGESELEQLYGAESSVEVRREILQAFFLAGDSKRLVAAAVGESNPELRRAAIKNLGLVGGKEASAALQTIYSKETDRSLKEEVLNAYFLEGNSSALVAIARSEKDPVLRKKAVEKLSLIGDKTATDYMMEILQK
jgi:hypothetical protein